MHKIKFLFSLMIIKGMLSYSQRIVVVDSIDKTPLSFVALKYEGGGLYSNENGQFHLDSIKGNGIQVSLLGYRNKQLRTNTIIDTIRLSLEPIFLDEIVVAKSKKSNESLLIRPPKKARNFGNKVLFPKNELLLILIPKEITSYSYIEDISFYFQKKIELKNDKIDLMKTIDGVIRINLYEFNKGLPSRQIYASNPLKINSFTKDEILLDLSTEFIIIPKEGICIGVEMIGYYDETYNEVSIQGYVRPMLTEKEYNDFIAKTFLRYPFDEENKIILLEDLFKMGGMYKGSLERNLSIGLTLSKASN